MTPEDGFAADRAVRNQKSGNCVRREEAVSWNVTQLSHWVRPSTGEELPLSTKTKREAETLVLLTHTHTAEGFINQHPVIPQHGAASPFHLHPKPPQLKNSLLCFLLLVLQTSSETTSLRCFSLELIKFLKKDETVSKKRVQVVPKMLNVTGPQISWGRRWTCCDAACRGHVSSRVRTLC